MKISEIDKGKFFEIFEKIGETGRPYVEYVKEHFDDKTNGRPELYTNMFIKIRSYMRDSFENKKFLEVGCGPGYFLFVLKKMGANVFGIDINDQGGLPEYFGINFKRENLLEYPYDKILTPRDIFPGVEFENFDVLLTRQLFEIGLGLGKDFNREKVKKILRLTKNLSILQIHELTQEGGVFLTEKELKGIGYELLDHEVSPYLTNAELYVLKPG